MKPVMRLRTFNKRFLFFAFFVTLLLVGTLPYGLVSTYVLRDVDNQLTNSLNNELHLIARQITSQIDQINLLSWKSSIELLGSLFIDDAGNGQKTTHNTLLETYFRQSSDLLAMVLETNNVPLYFLKEDAVSRLSAQDAAGVGRLFTSPCNRQAREKFTVCAPIFLHVDNSQEIFLPMELRLDKRGEKTMLRYIFQLSEVLLRIGEEARLEIESRSMEMYVIDGQGAVMYASGGAAFPVGSRLDYPITDDVVKSLDGLSRVSRLERFEFKGVSYVGDYVVSGSLDLAAVLVDQRDSAYALVRETRKRIIFNVLISFIFCALLSMVLSWFFSRFIVRAEEAWREAKEAAETVGRTKARFLAIMSHELRTPMTGVVGMAGLLLDTPLNREQRNFATIIRDSGNNLIALINEILDFSKIEANKMVIEEQPFILHDSVENVLTLLAPGAEEKGIELIADIDPQLPWQIRGDAVRFQQVLHNLLGNAVKFTDSGQVEIIVTVGGDSADLLECRVRDTGIGIAEQDIEQLFKSFTQVDSSTTRKYGGTGLGLNICFRLVKLMGGTITVQSQPGHGTCFTVTLPLRAGDCQEAPAWMEADTVGLCGRNVLLFTANESLGRALERRLLYYGTEVLMNPGCDTVAVGGQADLLIMDGTFSSQLGQGERDCMAALDLARPPVVLLPLGVPYLMSGCRFSREPVIVRKPVAIESLFHALTGMDSGQEAARVEEPKSGSEEETSCPALEEKTPRVLVAEDNRTNQILALKFLTALGIHGDVADNGAEALQFLTESSYDLVFMDMRMPEMDGMEVTRRIRDELPADHQPKIVAMTANVSQQDREACQRSGMDDFVAKPFSRADFERVLAPWLGSRRPVEITLPLQPAESIFDGKSAEPATPVFVDVNKFAELCQLNEELANPDDEISMLEELFNAYHEQAPASIALMVELAADKEYQSLAAEAHKLRGLCLNLGLNAMAVLAETIENTNEEDSAALEELVSQLENSHTRTNAALAVILPGSCQQYND